MGDKSAIEWTDATWNPTLGCTKVSDGCTNCYAIRVAHRNVGFPQMANDYQGLTRQFPDGSLNWTGRVNMLRDRLDTPLRWKRPRRIFVNSMSDLFHEAIPDGFIERVWTVMEACPQHQFQVLTKRPGRMRAFVEERQYEWRHLHNVDGNILGVTGATWPPRNIWLGVSAEDQRTADDRIPLLLQTPAAVRFLSCEPLLGPITLGSYLFPRPTHDEDDHSALRAIRWVITGGESGPNWRPMDPAWARSIRDQCVTAGVAFFHKQNGGRTPKASGRLLDGEVWSEYPV